MIIPASFVDPLDRFPVLPYAIQVLRAVIRETVPEEEQDQLDVVLAPLLNDHEYNPADGRLRLCFMIGDKVLCRIPLRVLLHAEASFLSRVN